ncbi:MAG: fatty acyl-AMP ligase [Gammaproteobacteria bacterium]|nr:fatty acyl-AMP ligase [Gammaproteobacteria bacterium]
MNWQPTSTRNSQPQRLADFGTLSEALDYAALGTTGSNFYDARGELRETLPYSELRQRAVVTARQLIGLGLMRGERIAIVADTDPNFMVIFFACQYAGLVPYAMPVPVNLGSHNIYVQQLRGLLQGGEASAAVAPAEYLGFLEEAAEGLLSLRWRGTTEQLRAREAARVELSPTRLDEPAYLQFTSGSTRFPQGVVITQKAVMSNLRGIVRTGLEVKPDDRCASWLPYYHDMGLVGFVLGPVVSQVSVDYLRTRDFAVRPLQWLRIISRNRCTIAFSPPFGFELCARRVRGSDLATLNLSCWRAAGVGAEMIRPPILESFASRLAPAGFDARAFLPCYGLAEASLAVSFPALGSGVEVMDVDASRLSEQGLVIQVESGSGRTNSFVNCGEPLPGHEVAVVDDAGNPVGDARHGRVLVRGPSLMQGYLNNNESTARVMLAGGWLDTGDLGYLHQGHLYITGRAHDVIIVNGRNIRAQDLEDLAENQPEVRSGDASAFALTDAAGIPAVVIVVECRLAEQAARQALVVRLQRLVYEGFGVRCMVELVASHTLPRTSSGKLSRAAARQGFVQRAGWDQPPIAEAVSG